MPPPTTYVARPHQVTATQFLAKHAPPYPPDVDDCGLIDGPHVHVVVGSPTAPLLLPVEDTDWIVYDGTGHAVLTDAQFSASYEKQTGQVTPS